MFKVDFVELIYSSVAIDKTILTYLAYWPSDIDYRVASLSTRYHTDKGIIPERLKSIGQLLHV